MTFTPGQICVWGHERGAARRRCVEKATGDAVLTVGAAPKIVVRLRFDLGHGGGHPVDCDGAIVGTPGDVDVTKVGAAVATATRAVPGLGGTTPCGPTQVISNTARGVTDDRGASSSVQTEPRHHVDGGRRRCWARAP
jgi:hypothetical protein